MFRDHSLLIFVHDKHHLKIGEPGLPVAAVEWGRRVVVGLNTKFQVADHDFTRFSLVPSGTMIYDFPESIQESFYRFVYICMYSSMCTLCVCVHVFSPCVHVCVCSLFSLSLSLSLYVCMCALWYVCIISVQ